METKKISLAIIIKNWLSEESFNFNIKQVPMNQSYHNITQTCDIHQYNNHHIGYVANDHIIIATKPLTVIQATNINLFDRLKQILLKIDYCIHND